MLLIYRKAEMTEGKYHFRASVRGLHEGRASLRVCEKPLQKKALHLPSVCVCDLLSGERTKGRFPFIELFEQLNI